MNNFFSRISASSLALTLIALPLLSPTVHAVEVAPSALATSGDVFAGDEPLQSGATLPLGTEISTKADSGTILRPVPGQNIFVDGGTSVRVVSAVVVPGGAADGGALRSSVVHLIYGHIHSTVAEPPTGENRQTVQTSCAELTSTDGSWSTWVQEEATNPDGTPRDSAQHAVAYAGLVSIIINRTAPVSAQPKAVLIRSGQVAKWKCDDPDGILEVTDLRTGTVSQFLDGNEIGHRLGTPAEIQAARDLLLAGLPAFRGTAATDHRIEFGQVTDDINEVLRDNNLGGIPPGGDDFLFPDFDDLGLDLNVDVASDEDATT